MVLKDVRPIIEELVRIKKSVPLQTDVGRYLPDVRVNVHGEGERCGIKKALRLIEQAPTIEAEPVRHGRWLYDDENECYVCSACGESALNNYRGLSVASNGCPHCLAKMARKGGERDA